MFILRGVLKAESQENVLMYLLAREKGYGQGIAEFYGRPQGPIQKQLKKMEEDGVVISRAIGSLREYQLNPRYVFLPQLKELLKAALEAYPQEDHNKLFMERRRPRTAGKKINLA